MPCRGSLICILFSDKKIKVSSLAKLIESSYTIIPRPGMPWGSSSQKRDRSGSPGPADPPRPCAGSPVTLRLFPQQILGPGSPQRCAKNVPRVAKKCVGDLSCQKCLGGPSSPHTQVLQQNARSSSSCLQNAKNS